MGVGVAGGRSRRHQLRLAVLLATLGASASMPWGPPDMMVTYMFPLEVSDFDWWNVEGCFFWPELLLMQGDTSDEDTRMYFMRQLNRHLRRLHGGDALSFQWSWERRADGLGAFAIADRLAVLAGCWAPGECALVIVAVVEVDVASGAQGALRRVGLFLGSGAVVVDGPAPPRLGWRPQGPSSTSRGWGTPPPLPSGSLAAAVIDGAGTFAAAGAPGSSSAHAAGLEGDGLSSETWPPASGEYRPPASGEWRHARARCPDAFFTRDVVRKLLAGVLGVQCETHHLFVEAVRALGQAEEHHEAAAALRTCKALQSAVDAIGYELGYLLSSSSLRLDIFPGPGWGVVGSPAMRLLACGGGWPGVPRGDFAGAFLLAAHLLGMAGPGRDALAVQWHGWGEILDDLIAVLAGALAFTEGVGALYDCCLVHLESWLEFEAGPGGQYEEDHLDEMQMCWIRLESFRAASWSLTGRA